ncbi:NAD-dependent protein deacetylase [Gemmiger sp. An50]|uniref:NAD-dependent protein deacetylase n=1 Tax=Gemmiger sp. An50 TaxID=1965639 RepID=UPI000B578EC9|nr:NAD-dependent protein deacetylase [Gemmiger sp. An50]OUN87361.1 NAD-dependent protein deacetylase [Gemmiger sp. An50]
MSFYEDLVTQTQMNYSRYYSIYAAGRTPYELTDKPALPYDQQIARLVQAIREADCVVVGGASGLSAAGGGDFYYEDNASYRKYFGKYAEKYHFKGAFAGMMHHWSSREEFWGYLATFLHTTQTAPIRPPYLDLDALLKGKDFFVLTTNQDTQFVKLYPEEKVAEIQGDHRFFQCAACCTDDTWDAVGPVTEMVQAMGEHTAIPTELIPRCPHCGGEAFPWVRGYGNFLQGRKYEEQYEKISRYVLAHKDSKILFLELGVGRLTPMFIQEPFWNLTLSFPHARYIAVNNQHNFLPKQLEDKGMVIVEDIAKVLRDARSAGSQEPVQ